MANTSHYTSRSPQFLDLSDSKLTWYDMILPDDQIISNPHADPQVPHSSEHWPLRLEQLSYFWSIERYGGWSGGDFTNTLHDRTRSYWILRFQPGTSGPQSPIEFLMVFDGFYGMKLMKLKVFFCTLPSVSQLIATRLVRWNDDDKKASWTSNSAGSCWRYGLEMWSKVWLYNVI